MAEPILTAAEMRAAEAASGVPVAALMERAGAAVAEAAWRIGGGRETLILCGPGNNGGDGYVAARLLATRGVAVRVAAEAPPRGQAAQAAAAAWPGEIAPLAAAAPAPVLIDALYGTGLARPVADETARALCRLAEAARLSIAVDLPSGIASDSGEALGDVAPFDLTVALGARKPAHHVLPGTVLCGQVVRADIGLGAPASRLGLIERPALRSPGPGDNKYTRGKLVVVGGAMPGAAMLAALAGQRAGAAYVELLDGPRGAEPHALVSHPWSDDGLDDPRIGAVTIGPGLGRDTMAAARLETAFASGRPLVLDADALTLIGRAGHERLAGHVLTPHAGEFVRLFGEIGGDRIAAVRAAASASGAIVLLKGADSIVAHPDGRAAIGPLAPSWLASAGTGDVLSGIIGALLAQGLEPFAAAQAGVWLHSAAARRAGAGLIADDLIAHLPAAVAACL